MSKKRDCQSLHVVMVRCYTHWFVPYMDGKQETRQVVFEKEEDAVKHAEKLVSKKGSYGLPAYEEVVVMQG